MKVIYADIQNFRNKDFIVNRQVANSYILQLFWNPVYIKIGSKGIVTPPHTLIILDKNKPHYFHGAEEGMLNDYVRFAAEPEEMGGLLLHKPIPLSHPERYHDIIKCISAEIGTANINKEKTTEFMLKGLLSKCEELFSYASADADSMPPRESFVKLRSDILAFPYEDWNVADMAKRCNLSVSRFQYAYKKAFSISPMADVVNARILRAKTLLTGSQTVKEIATACGYKSDIHFMNQFKKMTGLTPSQYRKSKQK